GMVLDPFAPARGRARPARLQSLNAMAEPAPEPALRALIDSAPAGLALDRFDLAWNLNPDAAAALHRRLAIHRLGTTPSVIGLSTPTWQRWQSAIMQVLSDWHEAHPDQVGPIEVHLIRSARALIEQHLVGAVENIAEMPPAAQVRTVAAGAIRALVTEGRVVRDGVCLRLPEHRAVMAAIDQQLLDRVMTLLHEAGLRPPIAGELATALGMERADLLVFLRRMAALGHLLPVAPNRFFLPGTLAELTGVAHRLAASSPDGSFDAAAYRDASGIGRNLTIEVLEFLDRAGVTRFLANRRRSMV
ncbi:MAG TPA: SelB C-terminal domain-containing protein, partial [Burkholderiaceae bacterium]|nr:SelB C-terminal domain-containing protein [Burkholderiaceae bacterium]